MRKVAFDVNDISIEVDDSGHMHAYEMKQIDPGNKMAAKRRSSDSDSSSGDESFY